MTLTGHIILVTGAAGAIDGGHLYHLLRRHHPGVDAYLFVAAGDQHHFLGHVGDAGTRVVGADRDVDAQRHQLGQLAHDEIAIAVMHAG